MIIKNNYITRTPLDFEILDVFSFLDAFLDFTLNDN